MRFLFLLLLSFALFACRPAHKPREYNRDSAQAMIEADSARKVMLVVHMEQLAIQRDSLISASFDYIDVGNNASMYCYKGWDRKLNPSRKAITIGVETNGDIILISCLTGSSDNGGIQHTSFRMTINDHDRLSGDAVSDYYSPVAASDDVECAAFNDENARSIAEAIATHKNDTVSIQPFSDKTALPKYQLQQRDKDAIAASMQLANILRELYTTETWYPR